MEIVLFKMIYYFSIEKRLYLQRTQGFPGRAREPFRGALFNDEPRLVRRVFRARELAYYIRRPVEGDVGEDFGRRVGQRPPQKVALYQAQAPLAREFFGELAVYPAVQLYGGDRTAFAQELPRDMPFTRPDLDGMVGFTQCGETDDAPYGCGGCEEVLGCFQGLVFI